MFLGFKKVILIAGVISSCSVLFALQVGEPAVDLEYDRWLVGDPTSILWNASQSNPSGEEPLRVVALFGTYLPLSEQMMPILNSLQLRYQERGLKIIAMSPEPPETVERFLEKFDVFDIKFNVATDRESKTTLTYAGQRPVLPKAFIIGKENQVLWSGELEELSEVLESIYSGTYDIEVQKKISPMLEALETALRSGRAAEIEKKTSEIFEIDPANSTALRARLFLYESANSPDKAWDFLDSVRRDHREISKFYYLQLELASRYASFFDRTPDLVKEYLENFPNLPGETASIAWMLLSKNDFSADLLDAAAIAVNALDSMEIPPEREASCNAARALLAYRLGKLDAAVAFQKKAVTAAGSESERNMMENIEHYYQAVQELAQEK